MNTLNILFHSPLAGIVSSEMSSVIRSHVPPPPTPPSASFKIFSLLFCSLHRICLGVVAGWCSLLHGSVIQCLLSLSLGHSWPLLLLCSLCLLLLVCVCYPFCNCPTVLGWSIPFSVPSSLCSSVWEVYSDLSSGPLIPPLADEPVESTLHFLLILSGASMSPLT